MTRYPPDRFGLIRREAARATDIADDHLRAAVRAGDLLRLIPGVFVESSDDFAGHAGEDALYRLRCIAVATSELTGETPPPLSFDSAAAMHGLPLLRSDRNRVHVTNGRLAGGSVRRYRHTHAGMWTPAELDVVDGIRVTSLERTAVDVAMAGTFAQGLTAFDGAIRAGADRATMADMCGRRRRQGIATARRALAAADPLSASVGESWSRAQMIEGGLPLPRLQREYRCGTKTYEVDFDWEGRMVGEFDGKKKYVTLRRPGESAEDAVMREKVREDQLSALGVKVIRWTWAVLEKHGLVALLRPWLLQFGLLAA
ncbi:hypothetical protein GTV32_13180 [Gordonia sp. SID5947]|uniref:hypothetical protein n=1 Tax=Gordonia sp. SID5947 TaxID=2690315 RepID=UPI00136840FE|nr:hypothetical protein [Gordonia sp. SID5947]MYR07199.1 hypothetical protein [Gordonia sp. SID5947]